MKTLTAFTFIIVILLVVSCNSAPQQKPEEQQTQNAAPAQPSKADIAKHGEYLVTIGGCHDCHSPKQLSGEGLELIKDRLLSGYPADRPLLKVNQPAVKQGWVLINHDITQAVGPWGVSFSANLTSDQTGTGNWSEEQFLKALKQGWYKGMEGTRKLLPPMPWQMLANMTDDDAKAIFAYLQGTNPINNAVPMPIPPQEMGK